MPDYISREAFLTDKKWLYCTDCVKRKGKKRGKTVTLYEIGEAPCKSCGTHDMLEEVEVYPAANVVEIPATGIGDLSDGYHTFNGLYYQRMILFAALVKQNKDRSWKSYRHEDGELCFGGEWFIVGIDTPEGSYTYHYEVKDWYAFDCEELPVAKHWDGHTEKDVTRLLSLPAAAVREVVTCEECDWHVDVGYHYCNKWCAPCPNDCEFFCAYGERPNCGADMRGEADGN